MVLVSYSGREINAKLVYYGPGLSGKTTNLEFIYGSIPQGQRGKMVSMKTKTERTLFFDFLPVHLGELSGFKTRFLLYTVPGQVYYNATRKLVLKGVDAVVFVADSKRGKMDENVESLENLRENLKEHGLTLDKLPWVIQYNKRDLPDIYPVDELEAVLNQGHVPAYEAVASVGTGVVETFKGISRLLLRKLAREIGVPVVGGSGAGAAVDGPAAATAVEIAAPAAAAVADPPPIETPVTVYAADSSWTPQRDSSATAFPQSATPPASSERRPAEVLGPAAADSGWHLPPVAEPVRIPPPGSHGALDSDHMERDEESLDHHVSVGERLRRWLSRSPELAGEEQPPHEPEIAHPASPPAEAPAAAPWPWPQPEAAQARMPEPCPDTVRLPQPQAVEADLPKPAPDEVHAVRSEPLMAPVQAPSPAAAVTPIVGAASTAEPPSPVLPPSGAEQVPAVGAPAPRVAQVSHPPVLRRRPREIIVPLELNLSDLADGVVLKVAIQLQQAHDEGEDPAEERAA